jgi:hypothetical protein
LSSFLYLSFRDYGCKGDKVDEAALKDLIRVAVALHCGGENKAKLKPTPRRATSKRAG